MNMFSCPKESNNNKMMTSTSISNSNNNNNEEFSFPVISNNNPLSNFMLSSSSASSSSLWRISSRVYHHPEDYEDHNEEKDTADYDYDYDHDYDDDYPMEVRSMCEEISPSCRKESIASASFRSKEMEVEESMDYLWEDFNEDEEKNEVKVRKFGEELSVLKMARMGSSRRPSFGNSSSNSNNRMLLINKFLKGLVSFRKSAQNKLLKTRF